VIVEHARGTPRGEDMRRDLDRGYSIPARRYGGGGGGGGGPRRGSGSRDKFGDRSVSARGLYIEDYVSVFYLHIFVHEK